MSLESQDSEEGELVNEEHWHEAFERAAVLRDLILNEMERIKKNIGIGGGRRYQQLWNEVFKPDEKRELLKYAVYHSFSSSSTSPKYTPAIDLPGEQSLIKFWEQKYRELLATEK